MVPNANLIDVILRKTSLSFWEGGLIHISNWFQPIHPKSILPSFAVNDNVYDAVSDVVESRVH